MNASLERMERETGWSGEFLFQVVENVREYAIFMTDLNGILVTWNIGARLIFGYDSSEAIGMDARLLFTPEDRAVGVPEQELITARTTGQADDERWHLRKDGSRFFASGIQTALFNEKGEHTGYAKIARDLTERIRFQEELAEAHSSLEVRVGERTHELAAANEQLRLEVVSRKRSEELRVSLLQKIVGTQENERKRISRELHDCIGQPMTALKLKLNHILAHPDVDPELIGHLRQAQSIADQIDSEIDFLAWELRPSVIDDLGIRIALENFVREWSEHFKTPAQFRAVALDGHRVLPEIAINLYRIAQEALNNVAKHANAKNASVLLELRDGQLVLIVEDDGRGFDAAAKTDEIAGTERNLGLLGMKERAKLIGGSIEFETAPGAGTAIFVRVPLHPSAEARSTGA